MPQGFLRDQSRSRRSGTGDAVNRRRVTESRKSLPPAKIKTAPRRMSSSRETAFIARTRQGSDVFMIFDGSGGSLAVLEPEAGSSKFEPDAGLIACFLDEQSDLSAVDRFAQFHADADAPLQGRYYSALMPVRAPRPGEQLAFEVDLDRCSGCKACVAACHNLNGLDDGESWRDVGLVIGGESGLPVLQHVTSACHHCLDPACLNVCPVDAYEKDPGTGIVRHFDDQCIGCRYCALACPYDAPKFHAGKGIVRKCDMCNDRLAVGEAPACVQACPHEAIRIRVVEKADIIARAETGRFLASAPDPAFTAPTTGYRSTHLFAPANARATDDYHVAPEDAHWPLIVMLVLTQLSVGGFAVELFAKLAWSTNGIANGVFAFGYLLAGLTGVCASVFHLGRPQHAYRALIGVRHSWLSREVLAFGLFLTFATVYVEMVMLGPDPLVLAQSWRAGVLVLAVAAGLAGVSCSVMVYHVVRRPLWHARNAGIKFAGTAVVLGLASALAAAAVASLGGWDKTQAFGSIRLLTVLAVALSAASCLKLLFEAIVERGFPHSDLAALRKTAALLRGPLRRPAVWRRCLGVVGGVALPALAAFAAVAHRPEVASVAAALALAASIAGEIAERYLFFTAVVRPKMPGGLMP
jgi:Fe-S-cluster-containing dehydrogenase component/DMSO reductase anchor subunit